MRNLASIQKIVAIDPIEGADRIEVATVLGWKVVVGKGEFKVEDNVVYIEIDSVLPDWPEFTEIRKKSKYVKTIRLRKQISQGVCMSMSILNGKKYENDTRENPTYDFSVGQDVTDLLKIIKYEPTLPACLLGGDIAGTFPTFVPKTDETCIQSVPNLLERHKGKMFYATEKLDGSSCTVFYKDGHIGVCGRNYEFKDTTDNAYRKAAGPAIEILNVMKQNLAFQGELLGPGINGSRKFGLQEPIIRFFNIFDIDKQEYVAMDSPLWCNVIGHGLQWVPVIHKLVQLNHTVDQLVELSKIVCFFGTKQNPLKAEGLVWRPYEERYDEEVGRLSFKCINPLYLLEE